MIRIIPDVKIKTSTFDWLLSLVQRSGMKVSVNVPNQPGKFYGLLQPLWELNPQINILTAEIVQTHKRTDVNIVLTFDRLPKGISKEQIERTLKAAADSFIRDTKSTTNGTPRKGYQGDVKPHELAKIKTMIAKGHAHPINLFTDMVPEVEGQAVRFFYLDGTSMRGPPVFIVGFKNEENGASFVDIYFSSRKLDNRGRRARRMALAFKFRKSEIRYLNFIISGRIFKSAPAHILTVRHHKITDPRRLKSYPFVVIACDIDDIGGKSGLFARYS